MFRKVIAIDIFGWSLRLGLALAPRDETRLRRRRRQPRPPDGPDYLRADIGLPPLERPPQDQIGWWNLPK